MKISKKKVKETMNTAMMCSCAGAVAIAIFGLGCVTGGKYAELRIDACFDKVFEVNPGVRDILMDAIEKTKETMT